jgi:hypothetical protein
MNRSRFAACLSALLLAGTAAAAAPVCTTGELFAAGPDFNDPMQRASDGQGLLDVPPLGWRSLLFVGDRLVTAVGQELWYSDLASPEPKLKRLAGREDRNTRASKPGKCRDARFANISGIALMSDGSLAGADQTANNIFIVTDPFGPACAVALIAGATEPQVPVNLGAPENLGDSDGPGASAFLQGPDWVAVVDDSIYFIDTGNAKLKKVLPDAEHTVQTVAPLPEGRYYAMIALDGKLYTIANDSSSDGFLLEIDPDSGSMRDVVRGRSYDVWQSQGSINVSGLATDGTGFFTTQSGLLLYVTLDGNVTSIAGSGTYFELEPGYDPWVEHPAAELQLWSTRRTSTAGANVFLAYRDGYVYHSAAGLTPYVERIACQ